MDAYTGLFDESSIKECVSRVKDYPIVSALQSIGIFPVKNSGNNTSFICPFHSDHDPSLKVYTNKHGVQKLHCFPCNRDYDFLDMVEQTYHTKDFTETLQKACDVLGIPFPKKSGWISYAEKIYKRPVISRADYHHLDGSYAFTKIRLKPTEAEAKEGKKFPRYGRIINDRWQTSIDDIPDLPTVYGDLTRFKEAVKAGKPVFYVEGEKDCDTLTRRGLPAVTCGGSSDFREDVTPLFTGAYLYILADNDEPGRKLAERIERETKNTIYSVIAIPTPDLEKGDITDFFEGYTGTKEKAPDNDSAAETEEVIHEKASIADFNRMCNDALHNFRARFHSFKLLKDGTTVATGVRHDRVYDFITTRYQYLHTAKNCFVYENGAFRSDYSRYILDRIGELIYPQFRTARTKSAILELIMQDSKNYISQDIHSQINCYPKRWICFRNGMYDVCNGTMIPHNPEYRCFNQIPWEYEPGRIFKPEEKNWIEYFLNFISGNDPDKRELFLEFLGLSMTPDDSFHKCIILLGPGGNGKSTLGNLFVSVIGMENCSFVNMDCFSDQFATSMCVGKLFNFGSDTSSDAMMNIKNLRSALSFDYISANKKYGDQFSTKLYAKMMFAANDLPLAENDVSEGLFRRLIPLRINQKPERIIPDLGDKLKEQVPYLISIAVEALKTMYERGGLLELPEAEAELNIYKKDSDSVSGWLGDWLGDSCVKENYSVSAYDAYVDYEEYCRTADRMPKKRTRFYKDLRAKGFKVDKGTGNKLRVFGLSLDSQIPR